jgi:4-hydroxyphenylpyruvate dioxygenase
VLTTPLTPIPRWPAPALHGDGVRDVAFRCPTPRRRSRSRSSAAPTAHQEPEVLEDEHGKVVVAAVRAYGDTIHSFVQRDDYSGVYLPGYEPVDATRLAEPVGLSGIDHVVANVELGEMDHWAASTPTSWASASSATSTTRTSRPSTRR